MGLRVQEEGASESRPVMGRIGVATLPYPKGCRLPSGVGGHERSANRRRKRRRTVGAVARTVAGAASATDDISVAGTASVMSRLAPNGRPRLVSGGVGRRSRAGSYRAGTLFNA